MVSIDGSFATAFKPVIYIEAVAEERSIAKTTNRRRLLLAILF